MRLSPLVLVFALGCSTLVKRDPLERHVTASDFRSDVASNIAVLPVEGDAVGGEMFPASGLREAVRLDLIREKNYSIPKSMWVDDQIRNAGSTAGASSMDATMKITVDQWDTTAFKARGVVYVGGVFILADAKDRELWRFECRDLMLSASNRDARTDWATQFAWAARALSRRVVATLPSR